MVNFPKKKVMGQFLIRKKDSKKESWKKSGDLPFSIFLPLGTQQSELPLGALLAAEWGASSISCSFRCSFFLNLFGAFGAISLKHNMWLEPAGLQVRWWVAHIATASVFNTRIKVST